MDSKDGDPHRMIARISGRLEEVRQGSALLNNNAGLWYEVLVPAGDIGRLARHVGTDVVLHTIHYVEGDPSHGQLSPRLIGFLSEGDREFFRVFTTVRGIGVRKALRALARPVAEVAGAIQSKDTKMLKALPEIGARTADRIIAELHDKVDDFAGEQGGGDEETVEISESGQEALAVLVQLGERRADAAALIERVLAVAPELSSPEEIIQQVYKLKAGGV